MYLLSAARWVDRVQSSTIRSFFFLILYIPQKNGEWKIGGGGGRQVEQTHTLRAQNPR